MYNGLSERGRIDCPPLSVFFKSLLVANIILFSFLTVVSPTIAKSPISEFNPALLTNSSNVIFLNAKSFWADNALPLRAIFFDKWGGPFNPEDTNMSDNYWKTDASLIHDGWRLAAFYRGELFIEANRDTVEILRMVNRKEDLPEGRVFDINMKAEGFSAAGFELSRGIDLSQVAEGLSTGFTARYLRGEKIQNGTITGRVISTGSMAYDFALFLDYLYDENLIYNRRAIISGIGNGYSLDLGLRYLINEKASAEVLFRDVGGRIYWRDVPYTTANVTSDIRSYDEEGYQVYRPTIQGYEGYKDFKQAIPFKTDVVISYQRGAVTLIPTVNLIEGRPLYWIDLRYIREGGLPLMIGYNTNYNAISAGTVYKEISFNIYLNDIDLYRASAVGMVFSMLL